MKNCEQLIVNHLSFAEQIAATKKTRVPKSVQYDELKSAAYMGLVDAANKYDEQINPCFKGYAYPRIAGAIKDYLRECGWGPRNRRTTAMSIDEPYGDGGMCFADTLEDTRKDQPGELFEKTTSCLSSIAKNALKLYYVDDLSMKEAGNHLGVTESRVSQIVSKSKMELRDIWASREAELWQEVA